MEPKQNIVEQFEWAVKNYPANIALCTNDGTVTYEQLDKKANSLAYLIRNSPLNQEHNVTLLLDHNEEMIVGILGILKAGKTYVPIDSHFPLERAKKIMNDSRCNLLITNRHQLSLAHKLLNASGREIQIINISSLDNKNTEAPKLSINENQPAYVLYTSGSTGQPKGVVQSHRSIVQSLSSYIEELDIKASDTIALTTPYSHTVSVIDIFSALFTGASVAILNIKNDFEVQSFGAWLKKMKVSIIHTVPTFYRFFMKYITDRSLLEDVRLVILGGEEVLQKDVKLYKDNFSKDCLFINLYGSSEVILGTINIINKEYEDDRKVVSIGYPFSNIRAVILDQNKKEIQAHGTGEIYLGAEFLDPKYYGDPQGTGKLFLQHDGKAGEKFIRTGDLVKLLPNGSIQLMGRMDSQIKINGNRVHLSEIELNLDAVDGIEQCVVVPIRNENEDISLVAYIKVREENPNIESIKDSLRKKLPEYMIPSFFVKLEKIPTTANGKVDRNGLPKLGYQDFKSNKDVREKSELHKVILNIWKSTFENEDITIHDNFFQLGGNSLMATEIVNKIFLALKIEIELSTVFDHQSVFEMARFLEGKKEEQLT